MVVAFGVGFLTGGNLTNLSHLKLRYWGLAFLGLGLQVAPYPVSWGKEIAVGSLLLSFLVLLAFALANYRQAGFALIIFGCLANFTVIAANWGMPVSGHALIVSDQVGPLGELERGEATKHHLATPTDHFIFLGDVIPIPNPLHVVVSPGDLLVYLGAGTLIVVRMRRPPESRDADPSPPTLAGSRPQPPSQRREG
jgi:hypothetical protein